MTKVLVDSTRDTSGNEVLPENGSSTVSWPNVGVFIILTFAALAYGRSFLMPVVLAFLLALVFSPVRRFLGLHGLGAGFSAFLIVGTLVTALTLGILILAGPITGWVARAPEIADDLERKVRSLRGSIETVVEAGEQFREITTRATDGAVQQVTITEPGPIGVLAEWAPALVTQTVFTLVLLFFLISSGDMFYQKIVHVLPTFRDKKRAVQIARDIELSLSRYLFTITAINAGLGLVVGLAMWLIGMPNPLLFGVIAFAFNYVPYLGAASGTILSTIVGLVSFEHAPQAFAAGALYFALTATEGQFVTPYFVGRRLELNTVVVFLSIALWAWLWSVLGMVVAVPLLVTIRTFCEHIPKLKALGDFLSRAGAETPASYDFEGPTPEDDPTNA